MNLKKTLSAVALACSLTIGTTAAAQDCTTPGAVTVQTITQNAAAACCTKDSERKIKKCLSNALSRVKKANTSIGKDTANAAVVAIRELRANSCASVPAPLCTDATAVTSDEAVNSISAKCCDAKFSSTRKSCLKKARRSLNRAKNFVGTSLLDTVKSSVASLLKDRQCGNGGEKSTCEVNRSNSDGNEGYLHKPVSDSTGSIVNLLPRGQRARSCEYLTKSGKRVAKGFSSGIHNGFREHWRPQGGGRCSNFPSNLVFACNISGKTVCYTHPNPCQRYD